MEPSAAPAVSLFEVFSRLRDPRKARGKVYPLASLLTLAATAMLCGARSLYAIAQWGRDYNHLAPELGLTRRRKGGAGAWRTPCVAELHGVFAALGAEAFEGALRRWLAGGPGGPADDALAGRLVAVDGKTLRGSTGRELPGVHLLAAWLPDAGATAAQLRVKGTNEHKTALRLLRLIPLHGAVVTGDAAFCHKDFCGAVVEGGGDYVVSVKDNQPGLRKDIAEAFGPAFSPS